VAHAQVLRVVNACEATGVTVSSQRLWFMDVDGVMAPFGKGGAFKDWVRSPHERFELWLSPIQAAAIRRVLEETETELIWVTTWAHEAAEHVEGFLGWPNHRFAPRPQGEVFGDTTGSNGRWWKLDAVERFLTELQPARYVWSDDDHPAHRADVSAALRQLPGLPLVQAPNPYVGLSERWIREAREHLSGDLP
jgi:hypothetical protein